MNQDIINSLVEVYKRKGLPMQELMTDPVFMSLPIEKQLDAVQAYAGVMMAGSQSPKPAPLIARSAGIGALSGAFASLPIFFADIKKSGPGVTVAKTMLAAGIATAGAGFGAIAGVFDHLKNKKNFEITNRYLTKIKTNGNLTDRVELLSHQRQTKPSGPKPMGISDIMRKSIEIGGSHMADKGIKTIKADKSL